MWRYIMNKNELIKSINETEIDNAKIQEFEKKYGELPEFIKKMISYLDHSVFIDDAEDTRLISFIELKNIEEDLDVAFSKLNILPLFDCSDNNFIVYNLNTNKWNYFNISDEALFNEKIFLEEIL